MIFDITESIRLFIVFVPQIFVGGLFFFLIFKILKRNTNRSSLTLSGFYFFFSIGFILNGIAVLLASFSPGEFIGIIYLILIYLIMFSFIFVIVFILGLLKLKDVFTLKKAFIIILTYGIIWLLLLFYPGGVSYSETWAPIYSFPLYIAANILFTVSYTIPVMYYSTRLRRLFLDSNLKKKLSLFLTGIVLITILIYGVLLYSTWQNATFKTVWGIFAIVLLISSGLLIYYGIGRDL